MFKFWHYRTNPQTHKRELLPRIASKKEISSTLWEWRYKAMSCNIEIAKNHILFRKDCELGDNFVIYKLKNTRHALMWLKENGII